MARKRKPPAVGSLNWLVDQVDRRRRESKPAISLYRIAKDTGISLNTVRRFFGGYGGDDGRVTGATDDDALGRCRLGSALAIAKAVGFRFELVPIVDAG